MLQKSSREKIIEIFINEPSEKHYLIELSKKAKIAHTSVSKILKELIYQGIIIKNNEKKGKRVFPYFNSNLENKKFKILKKIKNLEQIYNSGLVEFIEEKIMPKSIILFGSYARGEDIEISDIDLFIESLENSFDLKKYEKKLSRKINLIFSKDINKLSLELKENVINGIILEGYIELK
jgi:predicted nucleotidyltransferase